MTNISWLEIPLIEWIGYLASVIVLVSLSLSSLVKLRIFNLFGSAIFSFYGFYIDALPVGIMNLIIVFFNIYYLRFLLFKKETLDVAAVHENDGFLTKFLAYHQKDIQRFFPDFDLADQREKHILLALRDMNVAGVFIATKSADGISEILLDYVTPQYRDYKTGAFLLHKFNEEFVERKGTSLRCYTSNKNHIKYLTKIGFQKGIESNSYALALA